MVREQIKAVHDDEAGATLVEFALLAPVLLTLLLGLFDMGFNLYTKTQLEGAIQEAARESTIEGAASRQSAIDNSVTAAVHIISPGATVTFDRRAFQNFSDVSRPEDYTDVNGDNTCNDGEPYEDANGNGAWDTDSGTTGFGGARDAVLLTVTVTFPRAMPVAKLIGLSSNQVLNTQTVLRNQPYGAQSLPPIDYC